MKAGFLTTALAFAALLAPPLHARESKTTAQTDSKVAVRPANAGARSGTPEQTIRATPALWVLQDKDTTIYLFGTIHMMKPQVAWFDGAVRKAYESADELVLEVTESAEAAASTMVAKAVNPKDVLTSALLPEKSREKFEALAISNGLPPVFLDRMKPWFVSLALSMATYQKLGYDPKQGIDSVLKDMGHADGKTLTGLETANQQIEMLDSFPQELQIEMLTKAIDEMDQSSALIDNMVTAWAAGEPDKLADVMNKSFDEAPEVSRKILFDRNALWATWVKERMAKPGTVFLAVGAGHLAGRESLQDKLAEIGLTARRVPAK